MFEELEKNLPDEMGQIGETEVSSSKETIVEVLARAADDHKFLARLAENPSKVLQEYNLTREQRAALARGDIDKIESWVGELDERLKTWPNVRLARNKW